MSTDTFNYEYYCNSSNESMNTLEMFRDTNHPLLGEYRKLLYRQNVYLSLMKSHMATSILLHEDSLGKAFNDRIMASIASHIVKNDTKIKVLYIRMTKKKTDRKAYCKKYYDEHRLEIAARHRLYDKSKYKRSHPNNEYTEQYNFQHKERYSLVGKMGRFFSFDKASNDEYFANLKRAVQNICIDDSI